MRVSLVVNCQSDFGVSGIALVLPGGDFLAERLLIGNAAVEALDRENFEFGFRQIKQRSHHRAPPSCPQT